MIQLDSSFRDTSGYVFKHNNEIYRYINKNYKSNYDFLIQSGLYKKLVAEKMLLPHSELDNTDSFTGIDYNNLYKIIKPEQLKFISYPYEWSFHQLKDAAVLTLKIMLNALEYNMILKDATAYNIQFHNGGGNPVFIDTLSFEKYTEGSIWNAYSQFCRHFLNPLVLCKYTDYRFYKESVNYIDGIPSDFVSKMLPYKTKFNLNILMHIHLNAKVQKKAENSKNTSENRKIYLSKSKLIQLIQNLLSTVQSLDYKTNKEKTTWHGYYSFTNYDNESFHEKEQIVITYIKKCGSNSKILDLGANNGHFSRIISPYVKDSIIISSDIDYYAVDDNYQSTAQDEVKNIYPLITDLTLPSPAIGFAGKERLSFLERIENSDILLSLALIHHIAITHNVPFRNISKLFSNLTNYLIIEWVPAYDSQTKKILDENTGDYSFYTEENFEDAFTKHFIILEKTLIKRTQRILYLMKKI